MKTRRTTLPVSILAMAALFSIPCLAKDDAREQSLGAAEVARFKACIDGDDAALGRLLDDELQYTHSNGDLESKSRFIAALHDGTRDYVAIDPTLDKVRIYGSVGLIHGRAHITVISGGTTNKFNISYDDVWLWKDGRWQMTSWRSTRLPEAPAK